MNAPLVHIVNVDTLAKLSLTMVRWTPFNKPLDTLELADFEALLDPPVEESLFVEYKSQWSATKVARAVASFANSPGGGTVIVGVRTEDMTPAEIVGTGMTPGQVQEAAVSSIRSSVAPVPAFDLRAVPLGDSDSCLGIQVPEGLQPPYLVIATGRILERTATSSEPAPIHSRDTLDRLYERGRRGQLWAERKAEKLMAVTWSGVSMWIIPAVEGGLGLFPTIFRQATYQALLGLVKESFDWSYFEDHHQLSNERLMVWGEARGENHRFGLTHSGIFMARWSGPQGIRSTALAFAKENMGAIRGLIEDHTGHRGHVVLAYRETDPETLADFRFAFQPRALHELVKGDFIGQLDRAVRRGGGLLTFEPEDSAS